MKDKLLGMGAEAAAEGYNYLLLKKAKTNMETLGIHTEAVWTSILQPPGAI